MNTQPDNLKERVCKILNEEVAPALQMDSGSIEVLGVEDGIVRLRLGTICSTCPSTIQAVILGLEEELRRRVPEVEYLEAVP